MPAAKLGATAVDVLWSLAAAMDGDALLDSWWFRPRDLKFTVEGLARCGHPPTVEVWCDVPAAVARQRTSTRPASVGDRSDGTVPRDGVSIRSGNAPAAARTTYAAELSRRPEGPDR